MLDFTKSHWRCLRGAELKDVAPFGAKVTRFTAGGTSYFLKTKATPRAAEREILITRKCSQGNFPTAVPIAADNGSFFVEHGGRCYVLLPELNGSHLSDTDSESAMVFGQTVAGFQNAVTGLPHNAFPGYEGYYSAQLGRLEKLRQAGKNIDAFVKPFDGERDSGSFNIGIIHRDPHPRNMLFAEGEFTGLLDFDLVKVGPRIFDPCYCATGLLVEGWQEEANRQKWFATLGSIVDGYFETVQPSFDERRHIWTMLLEIQLIFIIWLNETEQSREADLNEKVFMWLAGNKAAVDQAVRAE